MANEQDREEMREILARRPDPEAELAFALVAVDVDDLRSLRWLAVCVEARIGELSGETAKEAS